jgi:hypothetical protein
MLLNRALGIREYGGVSNAGDSSSASADKSDVLPRPESLGIGLKPDGRRASPKGGGHVPSDDDGDLAGCDGG